MSDVEKLLEALLNGDSSDITPDSKVESYLLALINRETTVPKPQSRVGAYLYALCNIGLGLDETIPNGDEVSY